MRPDTTLEGLTSLKPVFRDTGVVTAGNASGIGDGAGAMIVAGEKFVSERGLKPLGRLVSWGIAGVDPDGDGNRAGASGEDCSVPMLVSRSTTWTSSR